MTEQAGDGFVKYMIENGTITHDPPPLVRAPDPEAAQDARISELLANANKLEQRARDAERSLHALRAAVFLSGGPLNRLARECHAANQTWWHDAATGQRIERNKGELLMLMVSEIAEAMEGERKNLADDKLPHRRMAEVELADVLIRLFDYAGAFGYDLDGAVAEKRAYNATRADHKPEARLAEGGKRW